MTICVGLFQIVAMIVLTMQLHRVEDEKLSKYEFKLYGLVTFISIILSIAVFVDTLLSLLCINNKNDQCKSAIISRDPDHNFYTGIFFSFVTLGMILSAVPLCMEIRALQKKKVRLSK